MDWTKNILTKPIQSIARLLTFSIIQLGDHLVILEQDKTRHSGDAELMRDAAVLRGVDGADFEQWKRAREGVDMRRHLNGEATMRGKDEDQDAVALLGLAVF